MLDRFKSLLLPPSPPTPWRGIEAACDHPNMCVADREMRLELGLSLGSQALGALVDEMSARLADVSEDLRLDPEHMQDALFRLDPSRAWHEGEVIT